MIGKGAASRSSAPNPREPSKRAPTAIMSRPLETLCANRLSDLRRANDHQDTARNRAARLARHLTRNCFASEEFETRAPSAPAGRRRPAPRRPWR
jgi:hypothetical protein